MVTAMLRWSGLIALACASGCAPLTFSKEEPVDFSAYPVVRVEVWLGSHEDAQASEYLVKELRRSSGFEQVVYGPRVTATALLLVEVGVSEIDEDRFEGNASHMLFDSSGRIIDRGQVDDESASANEAASDVLDEVALHYHHAYRI